VIGVSALAAVVAVVSATLARPAGATVWVQTMDSCKQALGGATYQLTGGGVTRTARTAPGTKAFVTRTARCPLQQGDCRRISRGCASFAGLPAGTYTLATTRTPPPNRSNPEGYAPCQGGSACRAETATVVVGADGAVRATVTQVDPDGAVETWPSAATHGGAAAYAGTLADPVVIHDFGLAPPGFAPQCDGDGDADDHLTGNMRAHCAYPEDEEASACQPYPWSCAVSAAETPPAATGGRGPARR
jgi:hypothetical protein